MTTDEIEHISIELGAQFNIREDDITFNSDYLLANYVDPAVLMGVIIILFIIVIAGILTICSIYYVSMTNKVNDFGKLRAIGATKKQIHKIVFREGLFVACIGIPMGVLLVKYLQLMQCVMMNPHKLKRRKQKVMMKFV